jgi:hypothetical protein
MLSGALDVMAVPETGGFGLFTTCCFKRLAIVFGLTIVAGFAVSSDMWSGCEAGWYLDPWVLHRSTSGLLRSAPRHR